MRIGPARLTSVLIASLLLLCCAAAQPPERMSRSEPNQPQVVRLWTGAAPGAKGDGPADVPTLTIYRPSPQHANGAAVVVCPGGGYAALAEHEGKPVAQWLNTAGVTGLVLKYRLGPKYHHPVMLEDVARAMRLARRNAADWKIDPARIGVLGFSAGGHLASTILTHFDAGNPQAPDPVDRCSSRPDFGVLVYPVITLEGPFAHGGSRRNLLGDHPSPNLVDSLSNQDQVRNNTPPCFLVHSSADTVVPFQNSVMFAEALHKHHVPVALHIFDHGRHGFGLGGNDPVLDQWPGLCVKWMEYHGWLKGP